MSAIAFIAAQILIALMMIVLLTALVGWGAWHFVYYVVGAKNPIGKTILASIAAMWVICAGIIGMM